MSWFCPKCFGSNQPGSSVSCDCKKYPCAQIADTDVGQPIRLCEGTVEQVDKRWVCGDCGYDYGGASDPDFTEL